MEEQIEREKPIEDGDYKRPSSLTLLCILTFIGSGMALFSNLVFSLFFNLKETAFTQLSNNEMFAQSLEMLKDIPREYFIVNFILSIASFFGAFKMWKLKKIGFHFYTASQLLILISSMYYIGINVSSSATFLTIAFILLYAMNLRFLRK